MLGNDVVNSIHEAYQPISLSGKEGFGNGVALPAAQVPAAASGNLGTFVP